MDGDIERILISEKTLERRLATLADEISKAFPRPGDGIMIVTVLSGSIIFLADLIRRLPMKMRIGMVSVSSYRGRTTVPREIVLDTASLPELHGRDVLIVDDILDTGGTLRVVQGEVSRAGARSVKTVVLLRKPDKAPADVIVDFVGFDIEDVFVVGYGLDYNEFYRNLPYVGVLSPKTYGNGSTP